MNPHELGSVIKCFLYKQKDPSLICRQIKSNVECGSTYNARIVETQTGRPQPTWRVLGHWDSQKYKVDRIRGTAHACAYTFRHKYTHPTIQREESLQSRALKGSYKQNSTGCNPAWATSPTDPCTFAEYMVQGPAKIRQHFPSRFPGHPFSFCKLSASIVKCLSVGRRTHSPGRTHLSVWRCWLWTVWDSRRSSGQESGLDCLGYLLLVFWLRFPLL